MARTESVAVQMKEVLDEYSKDVKDATNNAISKTSKESVQKLRNTSPKDTGKYAKGWKIKKERGRDGIETVTVHNKTNYQLTHLLENGHVVRNAKGTYGRTNGIKHIAPVEEWAATELPLEIERELE
ncbi:MAG: HK97 gp10 family phage protein [Lachnospiraceae bacterium]|nr:HK97 gp10 family phage protein [Lachnospiraceae bacterium]